MSLSLSYSSICGGERPSDQSQRQFAETKGGDLRLLFRGNAQLACAIVRNRSRSRASISSALFPVAQTMNMNPNRRRTPGSLQRARPTHLREPRRRGLLFRRQIVRLRESAPRAPRDRRSADGARTLRASPFRSSRTIRSARQRAASRRCPNGRRAIMRSTHRDDPHARARISRAASDVAASISCERAMGPSAQSLADPPHYSRASVA